MNRRDLFKGLLASLAAVVGAKFAVAKPAGMKMKAGVSDYPTFVLPDDMLFQKAVVKSYRFADGAVVQIELRFEKQESFWKSTGFYYVVTNFHLRPEVKEPWICGFDVLRWQFAETPEGYDKALAEASKLTKRYGEQNPGWDYCRIQTGAYSNIALEKENPMQFVERFDI